MNKNDFKDDPINWADLKCYEVELVTKDDMSNIWRAYIDEADSRAYLFKKHIGETLEKKYGIKAEIVTQW